MEEYYAYLSMYKELLEQLKELERLQKLIVHLSKYITNNQKERNSKELELKNAELELEELKNKLMLMDFVDSTQNVKLFGHISNDIKRVMGVHRNKIQSLKIEDHRIKSATEEKIKAKEKLHYQVSSIKELSLKLFTAVPTLEDLPQGTLIDNIFREFCLYLKEKMITIIYNIKMKNNINSEELYNNVCNLQDILVSISIFNKEQSNLDSEQLLMLQDFFELLYKLLINRNNSSINEEIGNECNFLYENLLFIYGLSEPKDLTVLYNEEEIVQKIRIKKVTN